LRAAIDSAAAREDFATASIASGDLANLLRASGRGAAALDVVDRKADFTRRAGHGPWAQLADKGLRLQILNELGRWDEVMRDFTGLRAHMLTLPDPPDANDGSIEVWNVREGLLDTGRWAALQLEQWQVCLDLNAETLRITEARGAPALERARTRFNDYGPLLRLQRHAEVRGVLEACLTTFQRENAIPELAGAYSALADLEDHLGHHEAARGLAETSFRFRYISSGPDRVAISHFNYANYLTRTAAQARLILAHRLAATLLGAVTQAGQTASRLLALGRDLRRLGPDAAAALPGDIATLRATVEQIEGVKFGDMLRRFIDDDAQATELLRAITAKVQEAQP